MPELQIKVMQHAHDLYVRCIHQVVSGEAKNVDQKSICEGTTYFSHQWTPAKSRTAVKNFNQAYRDVLEGDLEKLRHDVETVSPT